MNRKAFISTIPFGLTNKLPLKMLDEAGITYDINPYGRKITEEELLNNIHDADCLIAGTEPITANVLKNAPKLKVISRVGVGIDNIDIDFAQSNNIKIKITPDGPSDAVAEYALALILSMTRKVYSSSLQLSEGKWKKNIGRSLEDLVIGIVGAGRIGLKLMKLISKFDPKGILFFDPIMSSDIKDINARYCNLDHLIKNSDVISIHVPLTSQTKDLISFKDMQLMDSNSIIINTSRGGVVNEDDLYRAIINKEIGGAALDVFSTEPYQGNLIGLENCLLSPHMSPMTERSRENMEIDAVKNAIESLM